ncbi:MAG: hypothetical protein FWB94_11335 [Chitinispirillia bacterium]|nr:hypothetical protein [Chitinispirillia bacterium]
MAHHNILTGNELSSAGLRVADGSPPSPFAEFLPVQWAPSEGGEAIYSVKRNHGISGAFKLHNLNDAINDRLPPLEKVLLEYRINESGYPVVTVADLLYSPYPWDTAAAGNILGEVAERIARRITKYFLKYRRINGKRGKMGGIFDRRFDPKYSDDYIVAHSGEYLLKIQRYPNLIILKQTGRTGEGAHGKFGYENIKELDGFFDYRYGGRRYILVLESKLERVNVNCGDLVGNLFMPLRELFPEAAFSYVLFTDRHSIITRGTNESYRQLKALPVKIYEELKPHGIDTLFFTFNETREDFERIKDFLITQYRSIRNLGVTLRGKTIITDKELTVFDGGETPHIKLVKDVKTGFWREVPMKHKS